LQNNFYVLYGRDVCGDKKVHAMALARKQLDSCMAVVLSLFHHPHASYAGGIITLLAAHKTHSAYVDRLKKLLSIAKPTTRNVGGCGKKVLGEEKIVILTVSQVCGKESKANN
jgi:hypothetical protein